MSCTQLSGCAPTHGRGCSGGGLFRPSRAPRFSAKARLPPSPGCAAFPAAHLLKASVSGVLSRPVQRVPGLVRGADPAARHHVQPVGGACLELGRLWCAPGCRPGAQPGRLQSHRCGAACQQCVRAPLPAALLPPSRCLLLAAAALASAPEHCKRYSDGPRAHLRGAAHTGQNGVYYGSKLGAPVKWCKGLPFSLVVHPQYVGSALTVRTLSAAPTAHQ